MHVKPRFRCEETPSAVCALQAVAGAQSGRRASTSPTTHPHARGRPLLSVVMGWLIPLLASGAAGWPDHSVGAKILSLPYQRWFPVKQDEGTQLSTRSDCVARCPTGCGPANSVATRPPAWSRRTLTPGLTVTVERSLHARQCSAKGLLCRHAAGGSALLV